MLSVKIKLLNNQTLNNLSKIFALLSACLLIYIVIRVFSIKKDFLTLNQENMATLNSLSTEKILPSSAPFTQYSSVVQGRNLFQLPKEKKVAISKETTPVISQTLTKNFKIMGIMISQNPRVVIQNLTTHNTSVLSIGDKIEDSILFDIKKDRIILENQGQHLEIMTTDT